ncbi:hypothetical protein [Phyllobacterium sp. K27]
MEQPDLVSKYRASLKEGDDVKILKHEVVSGFPNDDEWAHAKVISSSEASLTVVYRDGRQEVVLWNSGRVHTPT